MRETVASIAAELEACIELGSTPAAIALPGSTLITSGERRMAMGSEVRNRLTTHLRSVPALIAKEGKDIWLGYMAVPFLLDQVADWLLRRGFNVGANVASQCLMDLVEANTIRGIEVLALTGIAPRAELELRTGMRLVPFDSAPRDEVWGLLKTRHPGWNKLPPPTAAVLLDVTFHPAIVRRDEWSAFSRGFHYSVMEEVARVLTAVGPSPVLPVHHWYHFVDNFPPSDAASTSISPGCDVPNAGPEPISELEAVEIGEVLDKYDRLTSQAKESLRVPLERLNLAMRRSSDVDAAIELRIALEALLARDRGGSDPISHLVRLRGTLLMDGDNSSKIQCFRELHAIYDLGSTAVHEGRLDSTANLKALLGMPKESVGVRSLLRRGFTHVASIIRRIIDLGKFPDWDGLLLGIHELSLPETDSTPDAR